MCRGGWGCAGGFSYDLVITARVVDRDRDGWSGAAGDGPLQPFVMLARQFGFLLFRDLRQGRRRTEVDGRADVGLPHCKAPFCQFLMFIL